MINNIPFIIAISFLLLFFVLIIYSLLAKRKVTYSFLKLSTHPIQYFKETKDDALTNLKNIILRLYRSKLSFLYAFILVFILTFISYAIFSLTKGSLNLNLYQPNILKADKQALQTAGRNFVNSINHLDVFITSFILISLILFALFYLHFKKKLSFKRTIILIAFIGIIIRLFYMNITDNIFTRQYDVWSLNYNGHYSITMHIYYYNKIPDLLLDANQLPSLKASYQFYHPKFAHYTYAYFMHFMSFVLNTKDTFVLYESIRILTTTLSILELYFTYKTLRLFLKSEKAISISLLLFVCSPFLIRVSAMSNNDPLLWFFIHASVYLAIKFFYKQNFKTIILLAFSIGLGMASKVSGAMIAIPIFFEFVYIFIKLIKSKKTLYAFGLFITFAIIVFPIGMYWPIYNYLNYNQPFNYVWDNLNHNLLVDPTKNYFQRFVIFPFSQYFSNIFMQLWASNTAYPQDYNIYVSMLKSSIFGEFSYTNLYTSVILYVANTLLFVSLILVTIYIVIKMTKEKKFNTLYVFTLIVSLYLSIVFLFKKDVIGYILFFVFISLTIASLILIIKKKVFNNKNYLNIVFAIAPTFTFIVSFLLFNIQMPYACTMDFRYLGILYFTFALLVGFIIQYLSNQKNKFNKTITNIFVTIISIYCISSLLFHLFINFNYI
ncbi:MAG: ArnT family glycosyltransferase [Bacilli bacterium]